MGNLRLIGTGMELECFLGSSKLTSPAVFHIHQTEWMQISIWFYFLFFTFAVAPPLSSHLVEMHTPLLNAVGRACVNFLPLMFK